MQIKVMQVGQLGTNCYLLEDEETRTAAVDHLEFLAPAHINDTVTLQGRVTYVGNTSMEVCVDTYVEHLECPHDRSRVNRAYLTMVAIGADGRPARVPALVPETSAERADFEAGKERRAQRRREKKD